jgi:[ribosomal protein S18]-alanine N-acetyltransferase
MSESTFRIRLMEGRDIPSVVSLDRQVFADPWPESAYVQEIYFNSSAHYFVLELLDPTRTRTWYDHRRQHFARLLGFVGMRVEGTRGHISTLAVRDEWRGQRFGEVLLLTSVDQAVRDGAHVVGLEVRISNSVAQALYAKYDFEARSRLHNYYANGEDAFYMQAQIGVDPGYYRRISTQLSALLTELKIERSATL